MQTPTFYNIITLYVTVSDRPALPPRQPTWGRQPPPPPGPTHDAPICPPRNKPVSYSTCLQRKITIHFNCIYLGNFGGWWFLWF